MERLLEQEVIERKNPFWKKSLNKSNISVKSHHVKNILDNSFGVTAKSKKAYVLKNVTSKRIFQNPLKA